GGALDVDLQPRGHPLHRARARVRRGPARARLERQHQLHGAVPGGGRPRAHPGHRGGVREGCAVTGSAPAHAPLQGLLAELTLEEKVRMLEGVSSWRTFGVERLGIPALFLTDGPHGVRKSRDADGAFGVADNVPSTAFPTSATLANSWDPENARRAGAAIGRE